MKILSIETSCDETAISIVDTDGKEFKVLGNSLLSQIDLHKEYGGVFPTLAKREHSRNLIPVLKQVLEKAGFENSKLQTTNDKIKEILNREPELLEQFLKFIPTIQTPDIDAIAVTQGPGLEPALWVGINFAKALSVAWKKPIIPVNHMEGHIFSALLKEDGKDSKFYIQNLKFPI
ncbi:MAG TPA: hypothetical protein QGF60_00645, partial [Candidatus Paceibacterota bacterium]|nr:hypothetical protein [Candidatus Paceibacterota bacterium]